MQAILPNELSSQAAPVPHTQRTIMVAVVARTTIPKAISGVEQPLR